MKVFVNGAPIAFDASNRKEEFSRLYRDLYEHNELVRTVTVDGVHFADPESVMQSIETANELHIVTENLDAVIAELTAELRSYLPKVLRAFDSIPELLYGEMSAEDWKMVAQLFEGMNWVSQSVGHLRHHAEKKGESGKADALEKFSRQLMPVLAEVERALRESDFTLAGDLLKYEMPDIFTALSAHLDNGDAL